MYKDIFYVFLQNNIDPISVNKLLIMIIIITKHIFCWFESIYQLFLMINFVLFLRIWRSNKEK